MEDHSSMFGGTVLCVRIVDVKCLILMCTMAKSFLVIGCLYVAHDELNQSVSVIFERADLLRFPGPRPARVRPKGWNKWS